MSELSRLCQEVTRIQGGVQEFLEVSRLCQEAIDRGELSKDGPLPGNDVVVSISGTIRSEVLSIIGDGSNYLYVFWPYFLQWVPSSCF